MTIASLRHALTVALVVAAAPPIAAAQATTLTIDCASRALPSQRAVAAFLGLHNAGQAYSARSRLMAQAARACHAEGAQRVALMLDAGPSPAVPKDTGLASMRGESP